MAERFQEPEKNQEPTTEQLVILAITSVALFVTAQKIYNLVQEVIKLTP